MVPADSLLDDALHERKLDVRMVMGLAGDRALSEREKAKLETLKTERGESLFSDMLYALTHQIFPARQARTLWGEITTHRTSLHTLLGRDPGLSVAAHDYLTNRTGMLKHISLIDEAKLTLLTDVAQHDGLTGLLEKTSFARRLTEELLRQQRYGGDLTLVLADLDHFKHLNDTFGHADGDIVLTEIGRIIRQQVRLTDVPGRYGGEEFAILLTGVSRTTGKIFAERLRQEVAAHFAETPYRVTMSIGLAGTPILQPGAEHPDATMLADILIRQADAALYQAKAAGRNCVKVSD